MTLHPDRDFLGYGEVPPRVRWPGDKAVAVSLVLNIEEGAEFALSSGDARNEAVYEVHQELTGARDLCMESHFEYGSRAGYWRIMRVLDSFGVKVTLNLCGRTLESTPWLARHAVAHGHEIMCHGWRWEDQAHMPEEEERALIRRCAEGIEAATGQRPRGWHVRSYPSVNTRRLLQEEGFLYDCNAYHDDLPVTLRRGDRPYVVLPYAFDTNDMNFYKSQRFVHGSDFARYCSDAFDWLAREAATAPRMMTIGLHTRILGRPGRIAGLEQFLAHLAQAGTAWVARRDQIAQVWLDQGL
ncbi:MAG: polysaccharide deacetylase family protein [Cypionkella sp.]|jgi:peptidoglycan/xylan/chitin deacetylase (PgdA/CDA1 family)|nr:polysaccharide deacetylase family protein [Cypionkella sp.]